MYTLKNKKSFSPREGKMNMKKSDYVRMDYANNYNGISTSKKSSAGSPWYIVLFAFSVIAALWIVCVLTVPLIQKVNSDPQYDERMTIRFDLTSKLGDLSDGPRFLKDEPVYFRNTLTLHIHGSQPPEILWCVVSEDGKRAGCMSPDALDRDFFK
jgi:hypothetical protein